MKLNLLTLLAGAAIAVSFSAPAFADSHGGGHHGKKGHMFERLDADGNGTVSEAEFMEKHKEKFSKMDANGDGSVTKDEAEAMREKYKEKRKGMREKRAERGSVAE